MTLPEPPITTPPWLVRLPSTPQPAIDQDSRDDRGAQGGATAAGMAEGRGGQAIESDIGGALDHGGGTAFGAGDGVAQASSRLSRHDRSPYR